jgi:hypothetical protein
MNNDFTELTRSYLSICNTLETKIEVIKKDPLFSNEIINCQITINDLIIQLQNIEFKIQTLQDNLEEDQETNKNKETDKIVDKTIYDMLPLFMLHMMNNDPNSILNKQTENSKQTSNQTSNQTNNQTNNQTDNKYGIPKTKSTLTPDKISKMLSLATTLMNLPVTGSNNVSNSNSVDDVD